jgi:hypothetical protein
MGFRELVLTAISMNASGKPYSEINRQLRRGAFLLGHCAEHGDDDSFEIRLVQTGELIRFNGREYSYSPQ